jgi:hypothetical protein
MPTLIADACLLITLGTADALWLLRDLPNWTSVTCERAVKEVVRPPACNRVQAAIDDGWLSLVSIDLETDAERLALLEFDAQPAFRGRADAEVLALAKERGFTVGSDDRRVRREALRFGPDRVRQLRRSADPRNSIEQDRTGASGRPTSDVRY